MKIKEIQAQVKAFSNYVSTLIQTLQNLDDTESEEGFSKRDNYFDGSDEIEKISRRYSRLKTTLFHLSSDIFTSLMHFDADASIRQLEELSRELVYISDSLEGFNADEGSSFGNFGFNSGSNSSSTNTPFSEEEQKRIGEQLNEIQAYLVKVVTEQNTSSDDVNAKVNIIVEEISELKESSSKLGRKDWRILAINSLITIMINFGTNIATPYLFTLVQNLFLLIPNQNLLNP